MNRQAPTALHERVQRANQRGANLFLSIHHDSAQPQSLLLRSRRYQQTLASALTQAVVDVCEAPWVQPAPQPAPQPDCR